ncbi:MAG TPA: CU044_2847 family protein [Actinoplanes sp.]|nr:CU044_2847 family protein [Actinoplanes sp.]
MSAYVELPIDGTETITVEISNQGLVRAGAGDVIGKATERLDEAVGKVVRMGQQVIKQAKKQAQPPNEIEVELGLKLTAKTNFVVAESTGEANFKVILKWTLADD